ncbi:hypothetical protein KJA13_01755 [Patescibacteria group bacterium]|nr:hypothetical protein [Patescibacteria group bacterium]
MFTSVIEFSGGRVLAGAFTNLAICFLAFMIIVAIGILADAWCSRKDKPKYDDDYHYGAPGSPYGHSDI